MSETNADGRLIEQLQQFGLKTYEAQCFVALSRVPQATARELSEITDVPRTRVYDAISVLETDGLVTVQHSSPKVFRAVQLEEAIDTLRRTYESRLQSVEETLEAIEPMTLDDGAEVDHEVWGLSGKQAITARTERLLSEADSEIRFLVDGDIVEPELSAALREANTEDVHVLTSVIGNGDHNWDLPESTVVDPDREYLSGLGFAVAASAPELEPTADGETSTSISRLLLIDGETVLLGTTTESTDEQLVCATGETNGLVVLARHLLAPERLGG